MKKLTKYKDRLIPCCRYAKLKNELVSKFVCISNTVLLNTVSCHRTILILSVLTLINCLPWWGFLIDSLSSDVDDLTSKGDYYFHSWWVDYFVFVICVGALDAGICCDIFGVVAVVDFVTCVDASFDSRHMFLFWLFARVIGTKQSC